MKPERITWRNVRAGDEVCAQENSAPVNIEWVAHDYDIANTGYMLVIFKGQYGIGIIAGGTEVLKTGHDFALGEKQRTPFQGVEAAFRGQVNALRSP